MEHRTLQQIAGVARLARSAEPKAPHWSVRRERLERLAELLEADGRAVTLFTDMECFRKKERLALRRPGSPLTIAFQDPQFRLEGLAGDSVGDGVAFFNLSMGEAHAMLCDCGYIGHIRNGAPTASMVAQRARALAARMTFAEIYDRLVERWRP